MRTVEEKILRRPEPLFAADYAKARSAIKEELEGAKVIVVGAAGSIGSAVVHEILKYEPGGLHLVDISENNLVELVRDIRSTDQDVPDDFLTMPVALGSIEFSRFLLNSGGYDYFLDFAAMKHVRSEKDPYSLMRMIQTNVVALEDTLRVLSAVGCKKAFSVSSDKAVNPANLMGATKMLMEQVHMLHSDDIPFSTARFANVTFSDGSLLFGFLKRFEKGQPLSAPRDVKRYFMSHQEAGQLCLLAAALGGNRDIFFPKLSEGESMSTFSDIAETLVRNKGYRVYLCHSEEEARKRCTELIGSGLWPCYFFDSDTTGEKPYEEFYSKDDQVDFDQYKAIGIIHRGTDSKADTIKYFLSEIERIRSSDKWLKEDMVAAIKAAVPGLKHIERYKNLDQRM